MEELFFSDWEVVIRLFMAVVLGGFLGLERTIAGKVAGVRTYALVGMGAALFVVVSQLMVTRYWLAGVVDFDPLRVASQVVMGIGFLGAGLIIFRKNDVAGLTTAAGLWVSVGVGLASGFGLYSVAVIATAITLFIFTVMWFIERWVKKSFDRA